MVLEIKVTYAKEFPKSEELLNLATESLRNYIHSKDLIFTYLDHDWIGEINSQLEITMHVPVSDDIEIDSIMENYKRLYGRLLKVGMNVDVESAVASSSCVKIK